MSVFAEAAGLEAKNRPFVFASILASHGSTPRTRGHMIVRRDGSTEGSVGGGAMERYVVEQALEALLEGRSRIVKRNLVETGADAVGMLCGGVMEVYIDVIRPRPRLLLAGGGHVNLALARAAALLEWELVVAEDRAEFSDPARYPAGTVVCYRDGDLPAALKDAEIDGNTWVVVATSDDDIRALRAVIEQPAAYIGMLGSKRKVTMLLADLRAEGFAEDLVRRVHAPVGLDIGAETPAEIAVSILGEILKYRTGRSGRALQGYVRDLVVVRGAGDLATGVAWRLHRSGFKVVCLEIEQPTVIRRTVSFAEAVFAGSTEIEGIRAMVARDLETVWELLESGDVPVLVDPDLQSIAGLKPFAVVDAIIAKKNLGMRMDLAPVTVALGPGFVAGTDVHAVVETNRGHELGRVILEGAPAEDTRVPGLLGGETNKRVIRSPAAGTYEPAAALGEMVDEGQVIARVRMPDGVAVDIRSPFRGLVRGMLSGGLPVTEGFKVGDVDPRGEKVDYTHISDKSRAIAGGVLEAILHLRAEQEGR